MKIIFSKNNNYFLERNEGIEPTTSNWNVRILPSELIPHIYILFKIDQYFKELYILNITKIFIF